MATAKKHAERSHRNRKSNKSTLAYFERSKFISEMDRENSAAKFVGRFTPQEVKSANLKERLKTGLSNMFGGKGLR